MRLSRRSRLTGRFPRPALALAAGALAIAAGACGHAPPPKPKATEQPVTSIGDLAGQWVADDAMDWGYKLTIGPDGSVDAWMDRGKLGRCTQKGKAQPSGDRTFVVTYSLEECHRDEHRAPGAAIQAQLAVKSFTGEELSVVLTFASGEERRTYHRMAGQ